jgi:hypothetical protein
MGLIKKSGVAHQLAATSGLFAFTQAGTSVPTFSERTGNQFGVTYTPARSDAGIYTVAVSPAFPTLTGVDVSIGAPNLANRFLYFDRANSTTTSLAFKSTDLANSAADLQTTAIVEITAWE